ncbi:heterokaryon incompatibility -domain-containing protein [Rutstroemia sp. NJR-2017a BVV2]|nr:heterokaryon incompatibility -domain-containing protein [Rutstroemia sp. NJR-2017a BVV2]
MIQDCNYGEVIDRMAVNFHDIPEDTVPWDVTQTVTATDPPRRLKLCRYCESIMVGLANLQILKARGFTICSAPDDSNANTGCSLRAIALAAIDAWKLENAETYRKKRDLRVTVNVHSKDWRRGSFYDVCQIALDYVWEDGWKSRLTEFEVYAYPHNKAAEYVSTRPVIQDAVSDQAFTKIKYWINDCLQNHTACPEFEQNPLPTRVLEVIAADGSQAIRVYKTHGKREKYAALSYCWGGPQSIVLKNGNKSQLETGIQLDTLPQTLQDAILVTRQLGLRFLWVDAMCIIQDSSDDKVRELKVMAQTYRNALITISAACSRSSRDGFLRPREPRKSAYPQFVLPYCAWGSEGDQPGASQIGTVILREGVFHDASKEPINRRAWTLQERLLSPRVVIYGTHELLWQCQHGQCIAGGTGMSLDKATQRLPEAFFTPTQSVSEEDFHYSWTDTVIDYTSREVSFETDRLVALSAIASEFQRIAGYHQYLAGLWRDNLPSSLMWIVDPSIGQALRPRPSTYVAPSWSWASTNGTVAFGHSNWSDDKPRAEILRCETMLKDPVQLTGEVVSGFLEIRGPLREAAWAAPSTLLMTHDPTSEPVGKVWMDANEEKPRVVYCLRLYTKTGLVLVPGKPDGPFTRIGTFEIYDEGPPDHRICICDDWFHGVEMQNVVIE